MIVILYAHYLLFSKFRHRKVKAQARKFVQNQGWDLSRELSDTTVQNLHKFILSRGEGAIRKTRNEVIRQIIGENTDHICDWNIVNTKTAFKNPQEKDKIIKMKVESQGKLKQEFLKMKKKSYCIPFYSCCNKLPQIYWLKKSIIFSSHFYNVCYWSIVDWHCCVISVVQQCVSHRCTHIPPSWGSPHPSRSPQRAELSSPASFSMLQVSSGGQKPNAGPEDCPPPGGSRGPIPGLHQLLKATPFLGSWTCSSAFKVSSWHPSPHWNPLPSSHFLPLTLTLLIPSSKDSWMTIGQPDNPG